MKKRKFWIEAIERAWKKKSVVWLQGVRRSGKTTLCKSLGDIEIFDCEKLSHRRLFDDPEEFFKNQTSKKVAIDEIHRLENPSEVLKLAADYFSHIKVIATGSSTLQAKDKFRDTLTDRKRIIRLTPVNSCDLHDFEEIDLVDRLFKGGLPPFLLSKGFDEEAYQDWIDSYWAKDIQELFKIENRHSFLKFFELLALQSGGMFEAQSFSSPCSVSRPTILNYLFALETTNIAYVIRPFFKNRSKEVISAPKVFFFDTGFISYFKGWSGLPDKDRGYFWEHFVLNELLSIVTPDQIQYWRDKNKNEIDFIVKIRGKEPIAIECKWAHREFNTKALKHFRAIHPQGKNLVIALDINQIQVKKVGEFDIIFLNIHHLRDLLVPTI